MWEGRGKAPGRVSWEASCVGSGAGARTRRGGVCVPGLPGLPFSWPGLHRALPGSASR